jgi:hypothetical protein
LGLTAFAKAMVVAAIPLALSVLGRRLLDWKSRDK